MARRAGDWPPYLTALALFGWSQRNWNAIDGRLSIGSGLDIRRIGIDRLCNIAYALQAEHCQSEKELDTLDASLRPAEIQRRIRVFERRKALREASPTREVVREVRAAQPALPSGIAGLMSAMKMEQN